MLIWGKLQVVVQVPIGKMLLEGQWSIERLLVSLSKYPDRS